MNPAPAIYDAQVRHARHRDVHTTFAHRIHLWLVDLDELPELPFWLRPFARFRAADHVGDPELSIRANIGNLLAGYGIDLTGGRVLMLAHARELGHVFNPISVFWCHRADGSLACVVAEVHNTYGGRHCYLLRPDEHGRAHADKEFYVSPFLETRGYYTMHLPLPGDRLAVAVTLHQDGRPALTATLAGTRRPAGTREIVRALLRRPFVTRRTSLLIRLHGIALWLRRLPVVPRPPASDRSEEGVSR
ncbi:MULTISPECIES: DUF1365 domain-containing protein [Pseudonocardia]|uniref:DUF1365 domain-containing protein n=2 Tax=Pseudonocardia TaxID=1847 RepID=A0A1Y2N2X3_PSEAH|nr:MULTISPECIES: DUF1365 domain-containing protein [Pseudonocardia]OSY41258.1 hypothetical protein BG845_02160 [Pseudonocardia autotrophica]TDN76713.1 hypothetical protein C8E95_5930 [Pseudonocardia autotrophica]BBG00715.1 DUF1365 domain-containing protein [Pseudonocardia autotrophica]GEC24319.1 DUF1365 domain-containing protein [Pseudonocardia saturnea]